ncbi:GNAT family N-acetyltransferase [Thermus filiformis]|uniref:Acetyltransferase n=1 Tax=Thermus filiformis TaxID=276 RepID=A0A0A2WM73_THEFI|nr:GNAT family N-acetyltransferase [Thermus filiformis]KGQ21271.1 acetyltransferase [Thermus filiformis]
MIRPVRREDLEGLLALLRWTDQEEDRKALTPEARDPEGLAEELEDGLVLVREGRVEGYVGLYPFWDGAVLEGPLAYRKEDLLPLLESALSAARSRGYGRVYAFPNEKNADLQAALERAGFVALFTTYYFVKPPEGLDYEPPEGVVIRKGFPGAALYREVYQKSEDTWGLRLRWSDEELEEHFQDPGIALFVAYENGRAVGMAEVEKEDHEATLAYLGVVPEARGKGIGRALLAKAADWARRKGARLLRVRAHDHEKEAVDLYKRLGFTLEEGVVTYLKEIAAR